jgi:plasmid stabilization system protein ParE
MTPAKYRVIITPHAFADLDRILSDVGSVSPSGAARVVDGLLEAMENLQEFPHRYTFIQGRDHPFGPVRRMAVTPYVVYYRTSDAQHAVRVLTVLHGSQRRPRTFDP